MRAFRAVSYVLWLAATRVRRRLGAVALALVGIAAAAAAMATVFGASSVAQDESLARAIRRLPPAERTIRASWFGVFDARQYAQLDAGVRRALPRLRGARVIHAMQFRQADVNGKGVDLAAADDLGRWVRLRSGRLPHTCNATRCEVVQVAGAGPLPDVRGLHLKRVGVGDLVSTVPFLQTTAYGRMVGDTYTFTAASTLPPFVITNDVVGATKLPLLRPIHRSYAWIVPLPPRSVHPWTVHTLSQRIARARSQLSAQTFYFDLTDPFAQLAPAVQANRVASRRLLLVAGEAAALLLAFVVLVAAGQRREAEATRERLARFGARAWHVAALSAAETTLVAVAAALVGWGAGVGAAAAIARAAGSPAGAVLGHSVASPAGIALGVVVAVVAAAVLLATLHAPAVRPGRAAVNALDLAALAALGAVALALARGSADTRDLAHGGGTGVVLFLLPLLIAFVAGVAVARLLGPAVRLLERAARWLPADARLVALSLARNPGYAGAAAAFLLVSVGLAAFSAEYRSTLRRAQDDQARFATPPDAVLRQRSLQLAPLVDPRLAGVYERAARRSVPVLRLDAQSGEGASSRDLTALALPPSEIRALPFWRGDFARRDPADLARAVAPLARIRLRGVRLPRNASHLRIRVRLHGNPVRATLNVAAPNGSFVPLDLGEISRRRIVDLALPVRARGGLMVGLAFAQTLPEEHNGRAAVGMLTLGPLSAGGRRLHVNFAGWRGSGGIQSNGARLSYALTTEADSSFRPEQPTDDTPIPVIASPALAATAGAGGLLPLRFGDVGLVVRVVRVATRFPSLYGPFVVADRDSLATALNSTAPGSAVVNEIWLDGLTWRASLARAVGKPPLVGVRATFRSDVVHRLRDDALARAVLWTLAGVGAIGFALALLGLALALTADVRDERRELFDLEAQGAGPSALRRHVLLRTAFVLAAGVAGGVALSAILSALVVTVVRVTANASFPEPPLRLAVDAPLLAAGLTLYLAAAAALASVLTWNAFRRAT